MVKKMRTKLVEGIGINDANYVINTPLVDESGQKWSMCPYYTRWKGILRRGYSDKEKSKNHTYVDCTVCEEWHTFSNFKAWVELQDWEGNHLDKDILVKGNKMYSPDTCRFVPRELNNLLLCSPAKRGEYPLGVYCVKYGTSSYYVAKVREQGVVKHLGSHCNPAIAHRVWQLEKAAVIERTIANYALHPSFDTQIAASLTSRVWQLRNDHLLNLETKDI